MQLKVLHVETGLKGHRLVYLTNLMCGREKLDSLIVPEKVEIPALNQYVVDAPVGKRRTFLQYISWLKKIKSCADEARVDAIHFLCGDDFYKYFGVGLNILKDYKVLLTLHWVRRNRAAQISIKRISSKISRVIVHSKFLKKQLNNIGVKNAYHIEYPQFSQIKVGEKEAKKYWGLNPEIKSLSCIGSTRYDKGLDLLIEALRRVEYPFQLLVAGQANRFTKADILQMGKDIKNRLFLHLHYLTEEELAFAIAASDVIVLPYRKSFNGASGPLVEGVAHQKCIVGSNHGNLGKTIQENHLGYTFKCEDIDSITNAINRALAKEFVQDEVYQSYRCSLNPDLFRKAYSILYNQIGE